MLNKIRQEETKPILVLDAGAMLFPQPFIAESQLPAKKIQATGVIQSMAKMGYDAFGIAPQDLPAGTDFLLQQSKEFQIPWLSMNLVHQDGKETIFSPYKTTEAGDLAIGILSLTGQTNNFSASQGYQIIPWEDTLKETLNQLRGKTDMNILLSSLPANTNRQIADNFHEIHVIIQSGQSPANRMPQLVGNTIIAQIGSKGKYIGRLDIDWKASRQWKHDALSQTKGTKDRLDRINWEIGRLKRRYSPGAIEQNTRYKKLIQEKNQLTETLKKFEAQPVQSAEQYSLYRGSFIGLPVALPEDQEIRQIVQQTKLAVNKSHQGTYAKLQKQNTPAIQRAFSNMAGWKACQFCHASQTEFWQKTGHAKAWETLVQKNQQYNPDCLLCHVTLPTYNIKTVTSQNLLANLQDELKGVGCETCHGPAKNHAKQPERFRPHKPDEKTCIMCHTPEHDDNFVYEEKLKKINCPTKGH